MMLDTQQLSTSPIDEQHLTSTDDVIQLSNDTPIEAFPPPCNSIEFIQNVAQIVRARYRRTLQTMFFIIIILILLSIISFTWNSIDSTLVTILGIFMIAFAFFLTVVALFNCCQYSFVGENHLKLIGNIQHVWQLTGETWHKQVDSLRTVPFKLIGFYYKNSRCQRLKNRLYGNIIQTEKGILIDELFLIDYGEVFVANITPIIDATRSVIFRMHLITRVYTVGAWHKGRPDEFDLDLFIPPNLQGQELLDLYQRILLHSRTCPVNFYFHS